MRHKSHRICPKFLSYLLNWLWPLLSSSLFSLCSCIVNLSHSDFLHKICMKRRPSAGFSVPPICTHKWWEKSIKTKACDCSLSASQRKSVGLLVDFLFVAIIAILPVTFQHRNLTTLDWYIALYIISTAWYLLLSYQSILLFFLSSSTHPSLLWGESGQGLNNCQTKLSQPFPQTEGWDQIDLWLKLNKWHLQQKRKKGFGRRRRWGDQSGSGWLDASQWYKKKNVLSVQEKNRQEKRGEKYWTEIRCRSLFNTEANLCIHCKNLILIEPPWNNGALRVSWAKLIGDDNLLFQHGRAAKQLVAA